MSILAHTQPRRASEIIDSSFRLYRAHLGDLIVISALLLVPPALIAAITPSPFKMAIQLGGHLTFLVAQGAIAVLVAAALQEDRAMTAGEVFRELGARASNVISVSIMAGVLTVLGFILLVIPGIIVAVWTCVSTPVAAIEGLSNSAALGRSRDLVRGQFWHALGTIVLAWCIVMALVIGFSIVLGLLFGMMHVPARVISLVGGLVMVPLFPLIGVTTSLLYFDLRVRNEGADVEALAQMLPPVPASPIAP